MGREKHKKHKKKHKKEKKKRKEKKYSSSSDSSEVEWVEKSPDSSSGKGKHSDSPKQDWLELSDAIFSTVTRDDLRERNSKNKDDKEPKVSIDTLGQSERELNPYWKDGGSGLPSERCDQSESKAVGSVGDMGLDWLKRALSRAKERAAEEKKSLESIVAQTWGSLDNLLELIRKAELKQNERRLGQSRGSDSFSRRYSPSRNKARRGYNQFVRPSESGGGSSEREKNVEWKRPYGSSERHFSSRKEGHSSFAGLRKSSEELISGSGKRGWRKESFCPDDERTKGEKASRSKDDFEGDTKLDSNQKTSTSSEVAEKESKEVEMEPSDELSKEIILTRTDKRGFTYPVQGSSSSSSRPSKSKKIKVKTHEDGQRVRYFADDDKFSLDDLVRQEKFVTAADSNRMFSNMAVKGRQTEDIDRDMDEVFEETSKAEKGKEWNEFVDRQRAVFENTKRERKLESCKRCMSNKRFPKDLVVSILDKVYLCVPQFGSITEDHCLIVPNQHAGCSTLLDEDEWEQIMDIRKLLVKMFAEEDRDVIFFEYFRTLKYCPHMVISCVPVPKDIGFEAPMYFKKALLECEMEWSTNKKLVDLKGRDVRKAIPKGLPYFFVDFGMESGYAHVIEDGKLFPRNFAEGIIGGMMDLDHSLWRKQKMDKPEVLKDKAQSLIKKFKTFTAKSLS